MKIYISITAAFLILGLSGCKKDYLSLENNPNQPSITTPDLALSSAEVNAAAIVQQDYPHYTVWSGYWTTSGNYVPDESIDAYQITTSSFQTLAHNSVWTDLYLNAANLNALQGLAAQSTTTANYQAIAMILKAYDFEQLVDNYNDVPYTQAFDLKNTTPVYDKGIDIYHDLGKQLDKAIALINANTGKAVGPSSADVVFGGNMASWKKFANSLKLRLAIRVYSNVSSNDPLVGDLASTASEGYLDGNSDAQTPQSLSQATVNPGYTGSNSGSGQNQENPFFGQYGLDVTGNPAAYNLFFRANDFGVTYYSSNNDLRLGAFYAKTAAGTYHGNVFGDVVNVLPNPNTSAIGPGLLNGPTQNAMLFTGAESLFLQAEALLYGMPVSGAATTPASAQAAYEAGITASFESLGFTYAQAFNYYNQPVNNVSYVASSNKKVAILTQKWAALNGLFGFEAYNEYRRTGVPALKSSIDPSATSSTLPSRVLYPTSEQSTNPVNLGKEGNISAVTSKIFWAK